MKKKMSEASKSLLKRVAQGGKALKFTITYKYVHRQPDGTDIEHPELEHEEEHGFADSELEGFNIVTVYNDPRHCFLPQKNPYRPPLPGEYYTEDELREACRWFAERHGRDTKTSVFTTFLCGHFHQSATKANNALRAALALEMVKKKSKDELTIIA